jgi:hypothetical protein
MNEDRQGCAHEGCPNVARRRGLCDRHAYDGKQTGTTPAPALTPAEQVEADRERLLGVVKYRTLDAKYKEALKTIERQDGELRALSVMGDGVEPFTITPRHSAGTSEATPVIVASDWHVDEVVGPEVDGLNYHNPEVAKARATEFFQRSLRLMRLLNQDVKIDTAVLALLGDFITGQIHGAENAEKNALTPNYAIVHAQNLIISGIEFLLNHTPYRFVLPCHSGNHARTTHTTRFGAENGHSLEYLMYLHLAAYFRKESRVQFIVPESMHSYLDVYGRTVRFQHGHAIKFGGGVGGLYIPVNKKIDKWNVARKADLDVFGHFHQSIDGGRFICNGSQVGYNAYALSIGAAYEPPKQTMFLLDKKRGRTFTMPLLYTA